MSTGFFFLNQEAWPFWDDSQKVSLIFFVEKNSAVNSPTFSVATGLSGAPHIPNSPQRLHTESLGDVMGFFRASNIRGD